MTQFPACWFGIRVPGGVPAMTLGFIAPESLSSLAEHLHLGVGVVNVDGDLVELVNELLDVLRLELGEVDRYPFLVQLCVDLGERLRGNKACEPDPGAQQLQRDPDVDLAWLTAARGVHYHHAYVLGSGFRTGRGSRRRLGLF